MPASIETGSGFNPSRNSDRFFTTSRPSPAVTPDPLPIPQGLDMNPTAIEPMAVARLRPSAGNARTHSKKQIRQIANSIARFGFTNPILIDGDGIVVAGHGRLEA